ncbi:MAG: SelB C-terminal domain-containing protein, partial [Pseudohongiellaceae bacterium]
FMERIQPLLLKAGRVPPRTRELVEQTGIRLEKLEKLLKELTRAGHLVQVADNRHFLPETLLELADFSVELAENIERAEKAEKTEKAGTDQGFTVIQFRDATGIGRNLCIEILEYFDGVGFTQRRDNVRLIRVPPARAFRFHPEH